MEFFVDSKVTLDSTLRNLKSGDILHLKSGIYRTKIKINISNITIIGEGNNTIISNKDYFNKINEIDNKEYLTVRTYTVLIAGDNVRLKNLTIQNESVPSSVYGQAVALEVLGDNFEATNVRLLGAQDTLLCGPIPYDLTIRYKDLLPKDELIFKKSRQYYNNCYIEGDTDFIFGSGIAYFKNCELHSVNKGYISAPSHPEEYKYGFVFDECIITGDDSIKNQVYLARPWRDYGNVVFKNCIVKGSHINKEIFNNWTKEREKTCRFNIYNTIDTSSMVGFAKILSKKDADIINKDEVLG